jgi:flavin-binding protein dodecin
MKFTKLQALTEGTSQSSSERDRRKWVDRAEESIDKIEHMMVGNVLKKLLKDGGFPETEAKAMQQSFAKFVNEFEDFKMAILIEFDRPDF